MTRRHPGWGHWERFRYEWILACELSKLTPLPGQQRPPLPLAGRLILAVVIGAPWVLGLVTLIRWLVG